MADKKESKKANIFSLKNIFFFLIILSIAQPIFINVKNQVNEMISPNTYIGCLVIKGVLYDSTYYVKQIHKFLRSPRIKGLLLKVNCQGGLPGSSQSLYNELKRFKTKKPVITLIEDLSASGGYYVSSISDKIIANPSALVGSIGVIMQLPNLKKLINYHNVDMNIMTAGKYKASTSPFTDKTPEEISHLRSVLSDSYKQFVKDIAEARNIDPNSKDLWAEGKIFTGNQALEMKLIDALGSVSDAKEMVANVLTERGVTVEGKIKLVYPKRLTGLAKMIYGDEIDENGETSFSMSTADFIANTYDHFLNKQSKIKLS